MSGICGRLSCVCFTCCIICGRLGSSSISQSFCDVGILNERPRVIHTVCGTPSVAVACRGVVIQVTTVLLLQLRCRPVACRLVRSSWLNGTCPALDSVVCDVLKFVHRGLRGIRLRYFRLNRFGCLAQLAFACIARIGIAFRLIISLKSSFHLSRSLHCSGRLLDGFLCVLIRTVCGGFHLSGGLLSLSGSRESFISIGHSPLYLGRKAIKLSLNTVNGGLHVRHFTLESICFAACSSGIFRRLVSLFLNICDISIYFSLLIADDDFNWSESFRHIRSKVTYPVMSRVVCDGSDMKRIAVRISTLNKRARTSHLTDLDIVNKNRNVREVRWDTAFKRSVPLDVKRSPRGLARDTCWLTRGSSVSNPWCHSYRTACGVCSCLTTNECTSSISIGDINRTWTSSRLPIGHI